MKTRSIPLFRSSTPFCSAALLLLGFTAPDLHSKTLTWNGGYSTTGSWNNSANWGGLSYLSGDDIVFGSTNLNNITNTFLANGKVIKSLSFGAGSPAYNVRLATGGGGGTAANLTFNSTNTGITVDTGDASSHTIGVSDGSVILSGNLPVTHNGSGTLTIDRPITGTGFGVTKSGSGTLVLSGDNTYSGATAINLGTLSLGAGLTGGKLNTASAITIASGATFSINRQNDVVQGTDFSTAAITGSGNFAQVGAGVTTLNAANNYTGTTTIGGGMLIHQGSATLTAGNLTLSGGGVLGLTSDFTRARGTGDNQVQWTGSGGFAAIGADREVSLNGGGNVQWSAGSFVPSSQALILGHSVATHTVTFTNNINLATSGTRTIQVDNGAADVDAVISGTMGISGGTNGGFIKTGAGTLELTNNTSYYTGTTTVANGKLIVNGNISTSSLTTVQPGATLGGSGTVGALTVNLDGILAPGESPGILNVNGDYTQNGTLSLELNGIVAGSQYDRVNVTGSVTLNGLLEATVGYTPAPNDLLFILLNDGEDVISGTFTGLAQGDTVNLGGFDWQISYTADSLGGTFLGGNDVALMAVPEPRVALLGTLGLLALLRRRRS